MQQGSSADTISFEQEGKLRQEWADNPPTTLQECLFVPGALFYFTKFLTQERSEENIELWHAVNMFLKKAELLTVAPPEQYQNSSHVRIASLNSAAANRTVQEMKRIEDEGKAFEQELCQDAAAIVQKFIGFSAPRQVNISDKLEKVIRDDLALTDVKKRVAGLKESLGTCRTEIFKLLSRDPFPRFTKSDLWKEFLQGGREAVESGTQLPVSTGGYTPPEDASSLFPLHLSYDEKYKDSNTASSSMAAILALSSNLDVSAEEDFSSLVLPKTKLKGGTPSIFSSALSPSSSSSSASSSGFFASPPHTNQKMSLKNSAPPCQMCGCTNSSLALSCPLCQHTHSEKSTNLSAGLPSARLQSKPLSSMSSPKNAIHKGPPQKYSNMTLDFQTVYERANAGSKEIVMFKDFTAKLLKAEQSYAKKLESLLGDEYKKLSKVLSEEGLVGQTNGMYLKRLWGDVGTILSERIRLSGKASDSMQEQVVTPLSVAEKHNATVLKTMSAAVKKAEAEVRKAVEALNKSKDDCVRTLQSLQAVQDKERAERVDAKKLVLQAQIKPLLTKATEQMQAVTPKIEEANKQQTGFVSGLSGHLDQLQDLDERRVAVLSSALTSWLTTQRQRDQGMAGAGEALLVHLQNDPDTTIQTSISDWLFDWGNKVAPEPHVYDLPLRPVDIVDGYVPGGHVDWTGDKTVMLNLMFGVPIPTILKREKNEAKEIPLILHTLCDAIRSMGGLETEGLFRKPPDSKSEYARLRLSEMESDNLVQLQRQFDGGNLSTKAFGGEPHVAAALLRLWLRQLPEPLISRSQFNDCVIQIQIAKVARQNTGGQKPVGEDLALGLFNKLPPQNQAVLSSLAGIFKDILSNSTKNHATLDAIAGHFVGGYITGARTQSDDALEALQQLRLEKCFLICLFSALCRR